MVTQEQREEWERRRAEVELRVPTRLRQVEILAWWLACTFEPGDGEVGRMALVEEVQMISDWAPHVLGTTMVSIGLRRGFELLGWRVERCNSVRPVVWRGLVRRSNPLAP